MLSRGAFRLLLAFGAEQGARSLSQAWRRQWNLAFRPALRGTNRPRRTRPVRGSGIWTATNIGVYAPTDGSGNVDLLRHYFVERAAGQPVSRDAPMHAAIRLRSGPIHAPDERRGRAPGYTGHVAGVIAGDDKLNADERDINGEVAPSSTPWPPRIRRFLPLPPKWRVVRSSPEAAARN